MLQRYSIPIWPIPYFRFLFRRTSWLIKRPHAVKRYLRSHEIRKLQIGSSLNILDGWLNSDVYCLSHRVVYLNATKVFPFENDTFDYIFAEHVIEHLTYKEGLFMLRECHRVLKPGGKIRIATPDLETLIDLYTTEEKSELQDRYIQWIVPMFFPDVSFYSAVFAINIAFQNWGHKFLYDSTTLQRAMEEARFVDISRFKPGESNDEALIRIESHGKAIGDEDMDRFETMVLEAKCPP